MSQKIRTKTVTKNPNFKCYKKIRTLKWTREEKFKLIHKSKKN